MPTATLAAQRVADRRDQPTSLTTLAVRGAAWTLPTSLGSRAIGLVGTLMLARYLTPTEYGEVSAAVIIALTMSSVTTFGVGVYLIATRHLSREDAFHASSWFLGTGVLVVVLPVLLSRQLGVWLGAPGLEHFMPMLALAILLDRVSYLPEKMLIRRLQFRWVAVTRAFSELAYTGVSVSLAALGFGPMSVVWGCLARSGLHFAAITPRAERREWLEPHRLRFSAMMRIVSYGMNVSGASIATFGMRRWDNLLVSRFFGPGVMGTYNYAYNLADTPAVAVGEQMSDVISAAFPHVEQDKRAGALVRSCTIISIVMFPLAFGLAAVAPTVVQTFFNDRWAGVGPMLVVLCVLSAVRPISDILIGFFYARERPQVVLGLEWASLTAIVALVSTVGRLGVLWTCSSVAGVFVLRTIGGVWAVQRQEGVPIADFLLPLTRPLLACVAMVTAILTLRPAFAGAPVAARLLVEVAVGAAVYVAGALLFARSASRDFVRLVRSSLFAR